MFGYTSRTSGTVFPLMPGHKYHRYGQFLRAR